ncbi:hypothetical protein PHMEG_0007333 [Phytophthora megakarya]|uniref:Uncharacterized protein n=1 Tax=Phytophthora megakarya TaxID=4795 RepID=A0A225WN38_9STRA|nr:hypothetical protein PHMEG_0007333 [Phytophthora megakarya]
MNGERFQEPGFIAPGAQKAWCKTYACPLDIAFLALLYNVESANHPWVPSHKRMPSEPQIFSFGNFVLRTKISIRAARSNGFATVT